MMTLFNRPRLILLYCLLFLAFHLFSSESWFKIWAQYRDIERMERSISLAETRIHDLDLKLKQSKELHFIEMQAKERLGLVRGDEYVFLFPEENN